jgi:hypothetical protein
VCPAATSNSAIARPLVSVSGVRESLTVSTKHATLAGACRRWSLTDMTRIIDHRGSLARTWPTAAAISIIEAVRA